MAKQLKEKTINSAELAINPLVHFMLYDFVPPNNNNGNNNNKTR